MRLLRRMKAEASLLIALADIGGVWPVMRVTAALTELADAAVGAAVRHLLVRRRAKASSARPTQSEPEAGSGYIVLAMGKMGAGELNYSSDIDLIVFYDATAPALVPGTEPAPFYVRITRGLVKLLQERTADGYVFRTDLRLRPDPGSTQIAVSTAAALDYYESVGRNWERAAMIKARACAGDIAAGEKLLRELSPFIWRKYLDFAAVADIHSMKRQIHAYRGHGEIAVEGHNVKLGRGGIREIEFFVQTQQLIAGGRHPELRGRETLAMLDVLAEGEWIGAAARDELAAAYRFLRMVEHRLQMVADEQTHTLPGDREGLERFARFFGFADRDSFAETLLGHLRNVQRHYATLFESAPAAEARARALVVPGRRRRPRDPRQAHRHGLQAAARSLGAGAALALGRLPVAARASMPATQLAELVPLLLTHFARSSNPDAALLAFDRFLSGLHGAGRLFSLLRQNPDLIALIAMVLGTAPRLADSLAQFPDIMDAVIDPSFFGALPEEDELRAVLDRSLRQSGGYEDFLDRIRIFAQEQMFLIGTRILSGTVSAEQAGEAFARLADMLVRSLHRAVEDEFIKLHGRIAGQEVAIARAGQARRPRDDGDVRSRPDRDLRFRLRAPGIGRHAPAVRRAVFHPAGAAADQRAHRADQLRRALPGRHAAAAVGPLRAGRDPDRQLCELPGDRSLDLGAHGADARPRGVGVAGIPGADRGGDRVRAGHAAQCRADRRRRRRDAPGDRQGEGRGRPLESQIRRRRAGRHRVHRAVPAARARRDARRRSSTPRPSACSTRRGGSACCRPSTPRCCARRCGSITT